MSLNEVGIIRMDTGITGGGPHAIHWCGTLDMQGKLCPNTTVKKGTCNRNKPKGLKVAIKDQRLIGSMVIDRLNG